MTVQPAKHMFSISIQQLKHNKYSIHLSRSAVAEDESREAVRARVTYRILVIILQLFK